MAYTKQNFKSKEKLYASQLNAMDDQILQNDQDIQGLKAQASGKDGGYYTPAVAQTSTNTVKFDFTPSVDTMPEVEPVQVTLPKGEKGNPGTDGKDGTSVTVTSVTESTADGGSNVVEFSDGKTITIKNGSKGSTGATGPQGPKGATGSAGKTPVRGTDYWTASDKQEIKNDVISSMVAQDAGESETLVMSQKAVTDLVHDALGENESQYETVDSVEEMTDTSKSYVLSTTGTVWAYRTETINETVPNFTNLIKFDADGNPTNVTLNQRLNSSGTTSAQDGSFAINDYIPVNGVSQDKVYINRKPVGQSKGTHYTNTSGTVGGQGNTSIATTAWTQEDDYYVANVFSKALNTEQYFKFSSQILTTALTNDNLKGLIVTHDEPITYTEKEETVSEWYDTGMKPSSSGGGGGNYVSLLSKVNENKTNITELDKRVIALETDADTLTVPSFWQDAVDACIAKIKALQIGRNCITFPFFSDNHQRNGYAGVLIAKIMQECHIPYCFFGGDSISSGTIVDEAEMIEQDKAFDTIMSYVPNGRLCRAVGNHDGYWYDGTNKFYYTREQVYELFLREESVAQNKHFGEDGTYYYIDDIASKTRFVVLNTNGGSVDATQLGWMQNTAFSFAESGWAVVFISHQPISNHYHAGISNAAAVRTVVQNYINGSSANKAAVVGWYSGHIHRDRIYTGVATNTTDDTQGAAMGFTQVTITSDHTGIAYDDATKHTVAKDDQSHAIDFVTINKATRTVNLTRLGIGSDRSYTY